MHEMSIYMVYDKDFFLFLGFDFVKKKERKKKENKKIN